MFGNAWAAKRQAGNAAWIILVVAALLLPATKSRADSGLYVGGSVGNAGIDLSVSDPVQSIDFDEDDFAWKVYGGFNFDVTALNLAVEGGYVDLGAPSGNILGSQVEVDANGFDVFGLAGFDLGLITVFGKFGFISWDAEATIDNLSTDDDGTDPAYGIGAKFELASLQIRAEYEIFDIDETDDVTMISAGIVFTF